MERPWRHVVGSRSDHFDYRLECPNGHIQTGALPGYATPADWPAWRHRLARQLRRFDRRPVRMIRCTECGSVIGGIGPPR